MSRRERSSRGDGLTDARAGPIFVVAPPRAGGRLVAQALAAAPETWAAPGSAAALLAAAPELDPMDGRRAGRLTAADCRPEVRDRLFAHLRTFAPRDPPGDGARPRLVDASPRNALTVPFLRALFPRATFVYVHRPPAEALAESLVLWRAGAAITYPALPGWTGRPWSFLLVPGWQELIGRPLPEIVTEQWVRTMRVLISDLERLPPGTWCVTARGALVADPRAEIDRLFRFLAIVPGYGAAAAHAPPGEADLGAGDVERARRELGPYLDRTEALAARARDWIAMG